MLRETNTESRIVVPAQWREATGAAHPVQQENQDTAASEPWRPQGHPHIPEPRKASPATPERQARTPGGRHREPPTAHRTTPAIHQVPVDQEVQQELRAELSYLGGKTSERSWWLITIGWNFVGLLRKLVNLQLFPVKIHSVVTGQTFGAESEILEQVKTIKSTHVQITTNYQNCDVIIVFCPIVSRAGSDVEAAMRQTPGRKPVILVLLHHTRDVDYSTDGKKWSEIYQNIVLDVDVLFHETQLGLLQCDRNKQAVQKIKKVLKEHSKWW